MTEANGPLEDNLLSIERTAYEDNLGPAGPADAQGPESLEQVIGAEQMYAEGDHSSDLVGIPSTNYNSPVPEFYSPEMFDVMQEGMPGLEIAPQSINDEIDNAIDQVASPFGDSAMESDCLGQPDPMIEAQQIFEEQMQFMEDPFMPDMLAPPGVVPGL